MARRTEGNEVSTPAPTLRKTSSQSNQGQRSILGFFSKQAGSTSKPLFKAKHNSDSQLTPAPSSDAVGPASPEGTASHLSGSGKNKENGLPSPSSASERSKGADDVAEAIDGSVTSSPSRKVKQSINYAESTDEDEILKPVTTNKVQRRPSKRRRVTLEDSEDEFGLDDATLAALEDADIDNFIAPDDSEDEVSVPQKRKRSIQRSKTVESESPPLKTSEGAHDSNDDMDVATTSTAQQWKYDPSNLSSINPRSFQAAKPTTGKQVKVKAHTTDPEKRHTWLATRLDADRHPVDHPDYDPRTLYIPPLALKGLSPFEQQYWGIKSKFMDTIVFFKKGKFYELYEDDATIGHQIFDLKLTDRVNMRMVGVPESSLDMWANQFVAKGYKIARVDQMENALGKEMRERDERGNVTVNMKAKKDEPKIIRRELAAVLTSGTLVDPGMLQDDMSTYCVAIKEIERDNLPVFGIAFVDAATAQFQLSEFVDDVDMTKFETFIAQIRPGELLLEKSCISARALRILKNNTTPMTLWNYLKPTKEFWPADITCREIEASGYFISADNPSEQTWPPVLQEAREKDLVMSAFGALLQYLRVLKMEREIVTLGNFNWYDPIRKSSSLVLDGQSLINLEVFANTSDGSTEGTLFAMLNRCITPFGKRLFRQWVCHPLADAARINARLDAVEVLLANSSLKDKLTACFRKLPDLERLISRIHAGRLKPQDFVKVLEGFEQIEITMFSLERIPTGNSLITQLFSSMPNISGQLQEWNDAFDHDKAKEDGVLVPELHVEHDFDLSFGTINEIEEKLQKLLKKAKKDLGSSSICFRDNGKEIYQLEVPVKFTQSVPKNWDQMSATKAVKRYYSPELRKLVRQLQEAQETHSQIIKEVAGRFYARFDRDYGMWLAVVNIVAQFDCLISLAEASGSLGSPSCRPSFVTDERTVVEFEELRHPCMLTNVTDFIPNDIKLGGHAPNINLLTGANAAGKSTVLRMTCVAVILAQIGCFLPCISARLTPVDRIMSRLGAFDNIFAAQSTFFVELSETKKILSEATSRSLVILDELGRGTSSYDGVAVAQAVLHDVATRIGCVGFFATHYHSLAAEFSRHPEIRCCRMAIDVDAAERRVTFLYRLEGGVAEGSFGMHCAAMCGIPRNVIERAEVAAREWEHTSRLKESLDKAREACYIPLGMQSDVAWLLREGVEDDFEDRALVVLRKAIATL